MGTFVAYPGGPDPGVHPCPENPRPGVRGRGENDITDPSRVIKLPLLAQSAIAETKNCEKSARIFTPEIRVRQMMLEISVHLLRLV